MYFLRSTSWILLIATTLLVTGCDLFGSNNNNERRVTTDVVIGNSGPSVDAADGTLTLYDPTDSTATPRNINVAFINSLALHNDRLFVVDNTGPAAGRITTFDDNELQRLGQFSNPRAPRRIAFPTENKGYVPNLSRNLAEFPNYDPDTSTVSVLDLENNSVTKQVDVGRSPEGIAVVSEKAFVANSADGTLSVLDTEADAVTNTLSLDGCPNPKSVFVDSEDEVTVVCQGSAEESSEVLFLNPLTEEIVSRLELGAPVGSANLTQSAYYSEGAEELYAISGRQAFGDGTGEIFRVDTDDNTLDATLEVPQNDELVNITAVGYDATTQDLYVTRLPVGDGGGPSFETSGEKNALVLDRDGNVVTRFDTGITPAHIIFLRERR
jgi:YVTN family beta-propeller protein